MSWWNPGVINNNLHYDHPVHNSFFCLDTTSSGWNTRLTGEIKIGIVKFLQIEILMYQKWTL